MELLITKKDQYGIMLMTVASPASGEFGSGNVNSKLRERRIDPFSDYTSRLLLSTVITAAFVFKMWLPTDRPAH